MNTQLSAWHKQPLIELCQNFPPVISFLSGFNLQPENETRDLQQLLHLLEDEHFEDIGIDRPQIIESLSSFMHSLQQRSEDGCGHQIQSLTIIGGQDKSGVAENLTLTLTPGSVNCIVGPTGSGKSRLLADIEWMAQGDTPTKRRVLVNGKVLDSQLRFSLEHKLVAQLSQNMNFVMDTSAGEFIAMHAESRLQNNPQVVDNIITKANELAGEPFSHSTPVTSLSGGQSRALMIADTAFLSASPVVLIDEVENAGIDRKKALQLLVGQNKIVLMSTHDPLLALMGEQRLVIKNGGITQILKTSAQERANLHELEKLDNRIQVLRNRLRSGERIDNMWYNSGTCINFD